MATIVKDLGAVTAYAYAVEKGYTGTEDEFAELMASYADVAEQAAESAAQAGASATAAEQAKAEAVLSASAAASSASTASTKASEAASSASSAAGSANTATTKASEASASATNAASSASAAATSATNAGASATAAAGSAASAETAKTAAETAQGKAEDAQTAAEDAAEQAGIYAAGYLKAFPVDTASGAVANFPDGADELPVKDLTVAIEPVQSGSGDPSPDNVRPISGWTGANVTRTGKNLLESLFSDGKVPSVSSGALVNANNSCRSDYIPVNSGSVTFSCKNTSARTIYCFLYGESKNFLLYTTGTRNSITATHADAKYAMIRCDGGATAPSDEMLELGSTATTYEAYSGNTYSITFPTSAGTVYGGTLDVTTGKLTVDRAMITLDGTQEIQRFGWQNSETSIGLAYNANMIDNAVCPTNTIAPGLASDCLKAANYNALFDKYYDNAVSVYQSKGTYSLFLRVSHPELTTVEQYNNWIAQNPITVVYPIATPIVYDLDPVTVTTLLGTNNVWADAGDSTVEYRADPTLYINKKIAALATAMN